MDVYVFTAVCVHRTTLVCTVHVIDLENVVIGSAMKLTMWSLGLLTVLHHPSTKSNYIL